MRLHISAALSAAAVACLLTAGCKKPLNPTPATPDAGASSDAGTPPACTVGCHPIPDAGVDGGYQPQPLSIDAVVPARGPITGGTLLQITGKGLMKAFSSGGDDASKQSTLLIGNNPATDYAVIDDAIAEFTAPPNVAGAMDVVLTNPNGTFRCTRCFTYFAPILLQSLSPAQGPIAGGTAVTLTGKGFTSDATVLFGDRAATSTTLRADGTLTAVAPPGDAPGNIDVRVFNAVGTSSLRHAFRYLDLPKLAGISPAGGPIAGGTVLTVTGAGLTGVTGCGFGAAAGTGLNVLDDGHLTVVAPAAATPGRVDVACTNAQGTGTLRSAFTYFDPAAAGPQVLGAFPTHGPSAGGNAVTLVGNGLGASGLSVTFGGQAAAVVSASESFLVVIAPAGPAHSAVDIGLSSGAGLAAGYTYNLAVQAVRPNHGPPSGLTPIDLDGEGFSGQLALTIGGAPATQVVIQSSVLLSAVAPVGAGGDARVRLYDANDPEDEAVLPAGFVYDEPLKVGALTPSTGAVAGGTYVTVYGSGFAPGVVLRFGDHRAKDVDVVDSHTLTCHTPAGTVGSVDVVADLDGVTDTSPSAFSYIDPTNQGGGASGGPLDGTLNVTVIDSTKELYGQPVAGASVILGLDPSTPFQGLTNARGQITFSDPSIVKPQAVTVGKTGYENITISEQASQNLTVYIKQNAKGKGNSPGSPPHGPPIVPISGHVYGFKPPRPLAPNEQGEAHIDVAPLSVFYTAPVVSTRPPLSVVQDGADYTVSVYPGLYAVYAIYGIHNTDTGQFTPVLMGIRRGIEVDPTHPAVNEDIVLDMHLDVTAPVTILNPQTAPSTGGPANNDVYAYLDLGAEGVVPLGTSSSLTTDLTFTGLPELDGSNIIFLDMASDAESLPLSLFYRRQPGDLTQGVTLGPLLGMVTMLQPTPTNPYFSGTLSWAYGPGPAPDLTEIQIAKPTLSGPPVNLWTVVLPGADTQVTLPPAVVQALIAGEPPGEFLQLIIETSRSPRFDYSHWSYGDLGGFTWTSFTYNGGAILLPRP